MMTLPEKVVLWLFWSSEPLVGFDLNRLLAVALQGKGRAGGKTATRARFYKFLYHKLWLSLWKGNSANRFCGHKSCRLPDRRTVRIGK